MSEVSVLGTGLMGAALVRAFLGAGHTVTLWNRTPALADSLVASGARRAPSAAGAFGDSPLSIVCVRNYTAAWSFMDEREAQDALAGRTLLQLSTGTPGEARESEFESEASRLRLPRRQDHVLSGADRAAGYRDLHIGRPAGV